MRLIGERLAAQWSCPALVQRIGVAGCRSASMQHAT
jgi:hypothetical protein